MKQPYNTTVYNTALYLRLSRDDELQGESGSIQTQRMMLLQYAAEHGLTVVDEYIDDGWSGTNFDRPSFQRMIDDIEDGKINCVVTKDLSRLGRNYILTGQYTEIYFPSKGVRYIAINDNVDTLNGESELAPFLNILNEMHARQTSKKVKAAMRTRFANGAHYGAYAPLGYVKDPDKKGHLLIDPETRWIVEKIFDLAVHGRGAASITRILVEEKVPTPGWLNYERYGTFANIYAGVPAEKAYAWTIAQVKSILKEETYIDVYKRQSLSLGGIILLVVSSIVLLRSPEALARRFFPDGDYKIYLDSEMTEEKVMAAGNPLNEELKQEILSIDGVTDIIPSRQSLYATLKTDIYQSGGMCDMLTDQNYATVEAALTAGTMPKDSRSIVIDYNVLKQNEDMGVGSTVDFYFGEGQPPVSVTVSGLFDSNKTPSGHGKLALDGVLFFAPEALFHELHPEIASFDYSWSIVNDPKKTDYVGAELKNIVASHSNIALDVYKRQAFTLFVVTFLVGITVHILILDAAFGTDCLKTSFQMRYSIINLPNINLGQLQIILAAAGLLSARKKCLSPAKRGRGQFLSKALRACPR